MVGIPDSLGILLPSTNISHPTSRFFFFFFIIIIFLECINFALVLHITTTLSIYVTDYRAYQWIELM